MRPNESKLPEFLQTNPGSPPAAAPPLPPTMTPKYGEQQATEVDKQVRETIRKNPNNTQGGAK